MLGFSQKAFYKDTSIKLAQTGVIACKGNLGSISKAYKGTDVIFSNNSVFFRSKNSFFTFKSVIENSLTGVQRGFYFELTFVGLGYRFLKRKNSLLLKLGYAHYIEVKCPESLNIFGYKKRLLIFGIDFDEISSFASKIRSFKKPDAYKGKGVQSVNEVLTFKAGKQKL